MRADRLLAILLTLQAQGRLTAKTLAQRLEVSERTIYRDIEALSAAGVPVYAERGPGGGCALLEPYRTTLTGMTELESRTLFVSGASQPLSDLGLGNQSQLALLKVLAALPATFRAGAEAARQRIHIDPAGWFQTEEAPPLLRTLHTALWRDCRLRLTYQRGNDQVVERLVEPLGLVAKASVWYLVARGVADHAQDPHSHPHPRSYKVSRISAVEQTEDYFERPTDFDLAKYWEASVQEFHESLPRYPVRLRLAPTLVPLLSQFFGDAIRPKIATADPPDEAGWIALDMIFESLAVARERVLGLGDEVEVLAPAELRASVAETAAAIVRRYAVSQQPAVSMSRAGS